MKGCLYVFEGVDGVGKTTLSRAFAELLAAQGGTCEWMSFPGTLPGSLGASISGLHSQFADGQLVDPTSLQLLHVAAHIDAIERAIRPALLAGRDVALDRYWWSTWVYGRSSGAPARSLKAMIALERRHWAGLEPSCIFLIQRQQLRGPTDAANLQREYDLLAKREGRRAPVHRVQNDGPVAKLVERLLELCRRSGKETPKIAPSSVAEVQRPLPSTGTSPCATSPNIVVKMNRPKPTPVFDAYWRFAVERQEVFYRRVEGRPPPWSSDPVIAQFKFTNAYRASDRTSQYLIRNVIYQGDTAPREVFFRTILFKFFNRIETWELLRDTLGIVTARDFDVARFDRVLSGAASRRHKLYSAAYIMPSGGRHGERRKHRMHLRLLAQMLNDRAPEKLINTRSMAAAFDVLRSYPTIGDFLAYQYITDLNYSEFLSFNETEFVRAGPGARDGIRKCFVDLGDFDDEDVIRFVADEQASEFGRRGLAFRDLWGRPLQLIDCQNLFCEIDKYARVVYPEYRGASGRTRIKQRFAPRSEPVLVWYPPKWRVNDKIPLECTGVPIGTAERSGRVSDTRA